MRLSPAEILLEARAFLGEGPSWDAAHQRLYWVDVFAGHLHLFEPRTGQDELIDLGRWAGCAAPTRSGGVILGLQDGIAKLDLNSRRLDYLAKPEAERPGNRFNDGKCSPEGRFLAGCMDNAEQQKNGSLYSLNPTGELKTLLTGTGISNGLAWSPDQKTFYYIDTPTREVKAFEYDRQSGEIANPRMVVSVPAGLGWPDGMTSDTRGYLWVALWGGAAVSVWDPFKGTLIEKIDMPAKNVSSCVFGGVELNELYVTSARKNLGPEELAAYPASGNLFRVKTNATGMPTFVFED